MDNKIKVLHLLQSDRFSGAENVVCQIVDMFKNDDLIEMAYCSKDGPIRESVKKFNISFYPMSKLSLKEVKRVIKEYKPDIIHAHDASASVISALLLKNYPIISHLHSNPPWIKKNSFNSIVYYLSSFRFNKILTVSESIMNEYVYGNKLREKTVTIDNPIDIQSIKVKANLMDINTEERSYDIAFLGRLAHPKNPIRFINLIGNLKNKLENISAIMIGDGELRAECENHIISLGLKDNIKITGFLDNPYHLLSKAKVLCITSRWEGYGLAAVEALALGLPVVSASVGGLPNIVSENCGKLCFSDEDFVVEINKLLTNEEYWLKKVEHTISKSEFLQNIEEYRGKIINVYNTLGVKNED
jgi:glycosyltransferase involved in cell wall biosynthesis